MVDLELNKEYVFVFKSENIKGCSGSFANAPTMSETLKGIVKKINKKIITIETTESNWEIGLRVGVVTHIYMEKLSYWFEFEKPAHEDSESSFIIAFVMLVLFVFLFVLP